MALRGGTRWKITSKTGFLFAANVVRSLFLLFRRSNTLLNEVIQRIPNAVKPATSSTKGRNAANITTWNIRKSNFLSESIEQKN